MREKLQTLPLTELKELAKAQGIRGISGMKKSDLIDLLCEKDKEAEDQKKPAPQRQESGDQARKSSGSNQPSQPQKEILTFEGLKVDFTGRLVYVDGQKVDMSPKEYDLFFYLVKNRGIALTREKLISDVWGYDFFGDDRTLDTHIKLLRKTLGPYSGHIVTLRGVGYRFDSE